MFEYEKMADKYGAKVTSLHALQIVSIPTGLQVRIDIGFDKGAATISRWQLGIFRRHITNNERDFTHYPGLGLENWLDG